MQWYKIAHELPAVKKGMTETGLRTALIAMVCPARSEISAN